MSKLDRLIKKRAECVENLRRIKKATEYEIKLIDKAIANIKKDK